MSDLNLIRVEEDVGLEVEERLVDDVQVLKVFFAH